MIDSIVSSTVDSSEAAAYVNQQFTDLRKAQEIKKELEPNSTNWNFEDSQDVHYGDLVYHIHHHSSQSDISQTPTSSDLKKLKSPKELFQKFISRKSYWILPLIISITSINIGISLSVYFVLREDDGNNGCTCDYAETTTEVFNFMTLLSTRNEWGAGEINSSIISKLDIPIKRIIIGHTRGEFCYDRISCISTVKSIQTQDETLDDIPYNYLIGNDGKIYEGRGIEYQGQHTDNEDATEYNSIGICIAFIGNYESTAPDSSQKNILSEFINYFVRNNLIDDDYIIVLQDDLKYFKTKANALNAEIAKFDHFRPLYKIYRREEWNAKKRTTEPSKLELPMDWVLIGHTVTRLCDYFEDCMDIGLLFQQECLDRGWPDTYYNIFFGGDGYAFEARGFDNWGAHAIGFNDITIGVGVIGEFSTVPPNQAIIDAIIQVFDDAKALGKLTEDYKIFGRSDFNDPGPGEAFMNIIKTWCHYGNRTDPC